MADITVDQAIEAIKTAATEIPADKFIDYSTILDVHLSYSREAFSIGDQVKLLGALEDVLAQHPELGTNIAWDLVSVLLPFLDEPEQDDASADARKTKAESLLKTVVEIGNPKEVILKIQQLLSQLNFSLDTDDEEESGHTDDEEYSDDEEETIKRRPIADPRAVLHQRNALLRFHSLLTLLSTAHIRLQTNFPSRFLSNSLTALLSAFTRSVAVLTTTSTTTLLSSILAFIEFLPATRALTIPPRPPLPPRSATGSFLKAMSAPSTPTIPSPISPSTPQESIPELEIDTVEKETRRAESRLEVRLLQAFILTLFELFALRCRHEANGTTTRGVNFAYSARYEAQRNPARTVKDGILTVDESDGSLFTRYDSSAEELLVLANKLGVNSEDLLDALTKEDEDVSDDEEAEISHPRTSLDIPFPKVGSALLLARRLFKGEKFPPRVTLFPDHAKVVETFFNGGLGAEDHARDTAVVDAVLFLGLYAADTTGELGTAKDEDVIQYLQTISMLSATFPSPSIRYCAKQLLQTVLGLHPQEFFALTFYKSTLENCPLENLKTVVVAMLKDNIVTALRSDTESVFSKPELLTIIRPFVFPDLRNQDLGVYRKNEKGELETLKQRINLLHFLTSDATAKEKLGVDGEFAKQVAVEFLAPVKELVEGGDVEMLGFLVGGLRM
ncbi:DUF1760-domain-containing protein [Ascobolus immersus RN42]|uniref:DUF1760-domain-containing protein n=1 Tax=Ascobolus immersus RN42 TaxID=1160509 RepID=A0A3N4HXL1_ASCIM|nr:DUF1760-domain-containing protein [Ascobolus immersus RN42]